MTMYVKIATMWLVMVLMVYVSAVEQTTSTTTIPSAMTTTTLMDGGGRVCGSCKMRAELRQRNLEAIKGEMLRRMGFAAAPNVTGRVLPPVPAHILAKVMDASGMQNDEASPGQSFKPGPSLYEEDDEFHIKTDTIVTFAKESPHLRHSWRSAQHDILHFEFTEAITKYHVNNATLFVYVKGADRKASSQPAIVHIEIFKVYYKGGSVGGGEPGMVKMSSKKTQQIKGRGDWVQIDVTAMVSEWFKSPRENLGFIISGSVNGRKVIVTNTTSNEKNGISKVPFVEITTREAHRRKRRNVYGLNCDEKTNESLCCRYPLTVDFEQFGWDFIIAPKRYEAHYCAGDCPPVTLQKYAHTHLLHLAASPHTGGGPCCTPRKLSAISMLYFDQQMNVVYGSLPGMVVDRCGCS